MLRKYAARQPALRWVSLRYGNVCGADPSGFVGEAKRKPHTLMTLAMYSLLKHHARAKGLQQGLHLYGHDYDTPDGTTVRDYVHPTDLAKAHVEALKYLLDGRPSDIFNLGTGRGSSVLEVLQHGQTAPLAVPQLGSCTSSGRAWWPRAARRSQGAPPRLKSPISLRFCSVQVLRAVEHESGRKVDYEIRERRQGDCAFSVLDISKARRTLGYAPAFNLTDMARTAWRWHAVQHEEFRGYAVSAESQSQS